MVWQPSSAGNYHVSKGYLLFLQQQEDYNSISSHNDSSFWVMLWKIKMPPKYLLFLFKLRHGAIPPSEILRKHHLDISILSFLSRWRWIFIPSVLQVSFLQSHLVWIKPFSVHWWWQHQFSTMASSNASKFCNFSNLSAAILHTFYHNPLQHLACMESQSS